MLILRDFGQYITISECVSSVLPIITTHLTSYSPVQISITLQAVLKQYALLEITSTEGYKRLRHIAKIQNT